MCQKKPPRDQWTSFFSSFLPQIPAKTVISCHVSKKPIRDPWAPQSGPLRDQWALFFLSDSQQLFLFVDSLYNMYREINGLSSMMKVSKAKYRVNQQARLGQARPCQANAQYLLFIFIQHYWIIQHSIKSALHCRLYAVDGKNVKNHISCIVISCN